MKYFTIVVVLLSSFLILSFTAKSQNKLKTGFYYLAENENTGELIKDISSEDIFAIDKNEILTVDDFRDAKMATKYYLSNATKFIELKLTKNGSKKWIEIQNRISKTSESIFFVCNDKIYSEHIIIGKSYLNNSKIDLFIELAYQEAIFNTIKSEISNSK